MKQKAGTARPGPLMAKRVAAGAVGLPARLAALINPDVLAAREAVVAERLDDHAGDRVRRRRAAEVLAHHLLENVS